MANPVLSRQWADTDTATRAPTDTATATTGLPEGPVSSDDRMTVRGTIGVTAFLLLILVVAGAWGWTLVTPGEPWPAWLFVVVIGSAVLAIVTVFQPKIARITAPIYAGGQGLAIGAISRIYEAAFEGIIFQAVLATIAIFIVMLILYAARIIKVTNKTRAVIIGSTLGIALFYFISIVFALFGATVPLVWDTGLLGIGFSALVIVVAAFNLMLDFDLIERGVTAGAPRFMEWLAALGLLITIVWLYLEMLRLLGKVRS